jgi:hypothetical protein
MHNDAARFNGIEQAIASRTDHKAPHWFFKHWRHLGMRPEMAEGKIDLADKPRARSLSTFFKLGKDLEQVVLCALLPNDFRQAAVSRGARATFPNAHRFPDRHYDCLVGVAADPATVDPCPAQGPLD